MSEQDQIGSSTRQPNKPGHSTSCRQVSIRMAPYPRKNSSGEGVSPISCLPELSCGAPRLGWTLWPRTNHQYMTPLDLPSKHLTSVQSLAIALNSQGQSLCVLNCTLTPQYLYLAQYLPYWLGTSILEQRRNPLQKRTKVLNHLHKLTWDICLLQETHLIEVEFQKLKPWWIDQNYHSTSHLGASILIRKNTPYSHTWAATDLEEHFITSEKTVLQ